MSDQTDDLLGEGIVYEDKLPITWRSLPSLPDEAQLSRWNAANEKVLRLASALGEYLPESAEEHSDELGRLEFKVNLLIELMGDLLAHQLHLPDPQPVRLNAYALQWQLAEDSHPRAGDSVAVDLYLDQGLPRPLVLTGTVMEVDDEGRVGVQLIGCSESVRDLLEKLIFRHHRRAIHHTRPSRQR